MFDYCESGVVQHLQPIGFLTAATADRLLNEFETRIIRCPQYLLVDLAHVGFIDSVGLGLLMTMHYRLEASSSELYLCSIQEQARCLLQFADVRHVFRIIDSYDDFQRAVLQSQYPVISAA